MTSNARSPITARGRRLDTDLDRAVTALSVALADLDPGSLALGEVTGLFELFTKARGLAGNGQTLLARRVEEARDWAKAGYPSAEEWIAAKAGTSVGDAKGPVTDLGSVAVVWRDRGRDANRSGVTGAGRDRRRCRGGQPRRRG